ncbi:MAG: MYG1 family protein [bacterium]
MKENKFSKLTSKNNSNSGSKKDSNIDKTKQIERVITHEGRFHTDEIFAIAILKDLFPETMELKDGTTASYIKYLRTRDEKILSEALESDESILVDVGADYDPEYFNFDHHQNSISAGARENGIFYASAGLIWKHYGKEWIRYTNTHLRHAQLSDNDIHQIWNMMDKNYVQFIDGNDSGQLRDVAYKTKDGREVKAGQFSLSAIANLFCVDNRDGKSLDEKFNSAVEVFRTLALSMFNKFVDTIEGFKKFDISKCEFSNKGKTLIFKEYLPTAVVYSVINDNEKFKDVEFYAVPNKEYGFGIYPAPIEKGGREYRNPNMIPKELRVGKNFLSIKNNEKFKSENIAKYDEILDFIDKMFYCSPSGYMASCKDQGTAEKFLNYCIGSEY